MLEVIQKCAGKFTWYLSLWQVQIYKMTLMLGVNKKFCMNFTRAPQHALANSLVCVCVCVCVCVSVCVCVCVYMHTFVWEHACVNARAFIQYLASCFWPCLLEVIEGHHFCHYEALFKISVDSSCCSWGLCTHLPSKPAQKMQNTWHIDHSLCELTLTAGSIA